MFVGFAYAPTMIAAYLLLDDLAPDGALTEAYTWLVSANAGGVALGSALAGLAIQYGSIRWTLGVAAVSAAIALVVVITGRTMLAPSAALAHGE